MAPDILHIDKRSICHAQHTTMDRTGTQIQAWRGVDRFCQRDQPGRLQARVAVQFNRLKPFHHIAVSGALGTAAGPHLALHLGLKIRFPCGAHDHNTKVSIMVNAGDLVIGLQHVLVEKIANRQFSRPITNCHGCNDFLIVQKQGQGLFGHHGQRYRRAPLINAGHGL